MLVSGSITNPSLLVTDKANPSQVAISSSPITTRVEAGISKPDSSSKQKNLNQNQKTNGKNNLGVEEAVREYFADIPLMAEISKCESRYRQYEPSGEVLRGIVNSKDVGALQVNETYHLKRSQKLGYDIYSLQGNMAYARLLYEESGPQPWASSYPCWGKSPLAANFKPRARATVTTTATPVTVNTASVVATADTAIMAAPVASVTSDETSIALNPTTIDATLNTATVNPILTQNTSVLAER